MSWRRSLLIGLTAALAVAACTAADEEGTDAAVGVDIEASADTEADTDTDTDTDTGPPVSDRTFETFAGGSSSLTEFSGEPLVVNFWASWCPPCVAEMPAFERVHLDRRDEVRFVGINTQDNVEQARELVERTGVSYDLGLDPEGELFSDFEVIAMPSTFFVDAAGAVVHRHAGILDEQQLQALIDEHLLG